MDLFEVCLLISGIGLVVLYLRHKRDQRELLDQQVQRDQERINEIQAAAQKLRDGIVIKKEDYEKAKLKVLAVIDGDKPDDGES